MTDQVRRLPVGAELLQRGGTHFRVWAPRRKKVAVVLEDGQPPASLSAEGNGYFSGIVAAASAGSLYRFQLDGGSSSFPDPASRYQPQGPHGPSQVIDPASFRWSDDDWRGRLSVSFVTKLERFATRFHSSRKRTFTKRSRSASRTTRLARSEISWSIHFGIAARTKAPVSSFVS